MQYLIVYLKAYGLTLAVLLVIMMPFFAVSPNLSQPSAPLTIKYVVVSALEYVGLTIIFSLPFLIIGFFLYASLDRYIPIDKRIIIYPLVTLLFTLAGIIGIMLYQKLTGPNSETIAMALKSLIFGFIGYSTIGFSLIFGIALWFVQKSNLSLS